MSLKVLQNHLLSLKVTVLMKKKKSQKEIEEIED